MIVVFTFTIVYGGNYQCKTTMTTINLSGGKGDVICLSFCCNSTDVDMLPNGGGSALSPVD